MKVDVVADVGNTRIKWGRRSVDEVRIAEVAALPDDADAWQKQLAQWRQGGRLPTPARWLLAGAQPPRLERLRLWLQQQGEQVQELRSADQLLLRVGLEHPDRVGMDRLLNAVAACHELDAGRPAILIDAGSAVTVDWLDEEHIFRGGAIFPGTRLMTQALHDYTALLPKVDIKLPIPRLPGTATIAAMQAGVFWAVVGGIERISQRLRSLAQVEPLTLLTGGDAPLLLDAFLLDSVAGYRDSPLQTLPVKLWPEQTLHGLLYAAEALP